MATRGKYKVKTVLVKPSATSRNVMVTLKGRDKCLINVPLKIKLSTNIVHYSTPSITLPFLVIFILLILAVLAYINAFLMLTVTGLVLLAIAFITYKVARRLEAIVEEACPEERVARIVIKYIEKCNRGESLSHEFSVNGWRVKVKCPGYMKCKNKKLTSKDKLLLTASFTALLGAVCLHISSCFIVGFILVPVAIVLGAIANKVKIKCPEGFIVKVTPIRVDKAWVSYYSVIPPRSEESNTLEDSAS